MTTHGSSRERRDAAQPGRAAGGFEIEKEHAHDLAESQRQDHQVDAADAQRGRADDQPGDRGQQRAAAGSAMRMNGHLPWSGPR